MRRAELFHSKYHSQGHITTRAATPMVYDLKLFLLIIRLSIRLPATGQLCQLEIYG